MIILKQAENPTYKDTNFTGIWKCPFGHKIWYQNGKLLREEFQNGTKYWYKNGKLHREDGPAIECKNGAKFWYQNGELHRENGPAIEYVNGEKRWSRNGIKLYMKIIELF